jgi:hypothetical protein
VFKLVCVLGGSKIGRSKNTQRWFANRPWIQTRVWWFVERNTHFIHASVCNICLWHSANIQSWTGTHRNTTVWLLCITKESLVLEIQNEIIHTYCSHTYPHHYKLCWTGTRFYSWQSKERESWFIRKCETYIWRRNEHWSASTEWQI